MSVKNSDREYPLSTEDRKILEMIKTVSENYESLLGLPQKVETYHSEDINQQCQRDWDFPLTIVLNQ